MPPFDIIVTGAGLVGLATAIGLRKKGHNVRVVEATSSLQVIGDAIAAAANQQRVLDHYGILDAFRAQAIEDIGFMNHRRYSDGEIISTRDMKAQKANYGYATFILSRAGYQNFLHDQAADLGVEFRFGSRVESLEDDTSKPKILLADGTRLEADIIVGADGVKSAIRRSLFPEIELTSKSNCYRATIPHERVKDDAELAELLAGINFFMGPNRLIVQSNMSDTGVISLNMYHPGDTGTAGAWKAPGDINHLREIFKDFSPQIRKLVHLVDECILWKVVEVPPLPSWTSKGGKVVLVGDAAHAMAPYQGQGCSSGIEDGGALAECLARAKSLSDVPALLQKYEQIRKPRTELLVQTSAILGQVWTMPDGEQQEQRDSGMRQTPIWSAGAWDGKPIDKMPQSLRDPQYQPWVMSHDAVNYANRYLDGQIEA